jgi:hypothetical protein
LTSGLPSDRFGLVKRLLLAKSLFRLGEIGFGAGLVSFWFTPTVLVPVKLVVGVLVVVFFIAAVLMSPPKTNSEPGEDNDG